MLGSISIEINKKLGGKSGFDRQPDGFFKGQFLYRIIIHAIISFKKKGGRLDLNTLMQNYLI